MAQGTMLLLFRRVSFLFFRTVKHDSEKYGKKSFWYFMKDFTLLQKATFYGLYDYADLLVRHGSGSKNLVDGLTLKRQIATPCPPIIFACYFGDVKLVKLLIDNKVGEI